MPPNVSTDGPCKHERQSSGGGLDGMCLDCGADVMVERVNEYLSRPTTDVSTDGLVEWFDEATVRRAFDHFQHHAEFPCSASAMREAIELATEALQRSNAEKDEALRPFAEVADDNDFMTDGATLMHEFPIKAFRRARKALSHSSETPNVD